MIELRNITIRFGERTLLERVNTTFRAGTMTALIGRNGAGKSSLLRVITGITKPNEGSIVIGQSDIATLSSDKVSRLVSLVSTERVRVTNLSCEDVVAMGRAPYTNWFGRMQDADRKIVAESLQAVGMEAFAHRCISSLSDGECQRVMIARALAQQTPVIILDEPTAFLDVPTRFEVCRLLARLAHDEQKCILFSTHDIDSALPVCDDFVMIDNGRLEHIAPEQLSKKDAVRYIFDK